MCKILRHKFCYFNCWYFFDFVKVIFKFFKASMQTNIFHFYYAVLMCFSVCFNLTTVKGQIKFQKSYNNEDNTSPVDLEHTSDGGYVMVGNATIIIPDSGLVKTDIHVVRTDADGAYRWGKYYGGLGDDNGYSVLETMSEHLLIGTQLQNKELKKSFPGILNLNPQGELQWAFSLQVENGAFTSLAASHDSNFFALGQSSRGMFLIKMDENGTKQWQQAFDVDIQNNRTALQATLDGGCIVAGNKGEDIFVMKMDKNGKSRWAKTYGGLRKDYLGDILISDNGDILVSGVTYNYGLNGSSQPSIMLIQLDEDGDLIWGRAYSDDAFSWNHSICLDYDGNFRLGGYRGQSGQPQSILLLTIDRDGELLRGQSITGRGHVQGGYAIHPTADSGIVVFGSLQRLSPSIGNETFYLVKTDANGDSGIKPENLNYQSSQASPFAENVRIRALRSSITKKWTWQQTDVMHKDADIREKLVAGNVEKPLDPREYVLAQARMRDSISLVALFDSTKGPNWRRSWELEKPLEEWYNVHLNDDGRVTSIILTANRLEGIIPAAIGNLDQLQVLWLNTNRLTGELPPEIGKLKSLQQLYLENNRLTGYIPPELTELEELQQIKLGTNQLIGNIPPEFGSMKSLSQLNLENNFFSGEIPVELDSLVARNVLVDLSNNKLEGAIPEQMLTQKRNIGLLGNDFTDHFQTKLIDKLGGQYESINTDSASFMLYLNETTRRFTLMEGKYGDDGGRYRIIKGKYLMAEDHLNLEGEILQTGNLGSEDSETANTEPYMSDIPVTFDDTREPIQVTLRAFERELIMNKVR